MTLDDLRRQQELGLRRGRVDADYSKIRDVFFADGVAAIASDIGRRGQLGQVAAQTVVGRS